MDLLRLQQDYRRAFRRERVFRDRENPFDLYCDAELLQRYRFSRNGIQYLIDNLQGLEPDTNRSHSVSGSLKVFIGLRFMATGGFQKLVGDELSLKLSQPTISRCVTQFLNAMVKFSPQLIQWPADTTEIRAFFFERYNIPNVVGVIDGTHVQIIGPGADEVAYVNRNNYHSINVQAVCDHNYVFTNVVAKSPGSFHDSRVLKVTVID